MASNDVEIKVKLDSKDAERGLGKVTTAIGKTDIAIGSLLGNIGADLFASLSSSAVSAFGDIFQGAAKIESTTKIFGTLLGSMEDAKTLVGELRDFAATTPFEIDGLNEAAKQLLTLTDTTKDNLIPTLKLLGDVASVGSNDITGLTAAFVKVQSQGRITAETFETLQGQSGVLTQALVKAAGVSGVGALREAMAKGKVDADVLTLALQSLSGKGGKAFQAMADQSKTLGGLVSNLSDTFTNLAGDIGTQLLPIFKELIKDFLKFLDENRKGIIETAVTVFGALGSAVKTTADFLKGAVDVYKENSTAINTLAIAIGLVAGGFLVLNVATAAWAIVSTASFGSVATAATAAWAAIGGPIGAIVIGLGLLVAAFVTNFGGIKDILKGAAATMMDFAADVIDSVGFIETGLRFIFGNLLKLWAKTAGTLVQGAIDIGSKFASIFGIELPASMTNFQSNILATSEEIIKGTGTTKAWAASLRDGANALREQGVALDENTEKLTEKQALEKEAAELEAVEKVERLAALNESLLGIDAVFEEERILREQIRVKFEAKGAKAKLKFLKDNLGREEAEKRLSEIRDLTAAGKFKEAEAKLLQLNRDALAKASTDEFKRRDTEAAEFKKQQQIALTLDIDLTGVKTADAAKKRIKLGKEELKERQDEAKEFDKQKQIALDKDIEITGLKTSKAITDRIKAVEAANKAEDKLEKERKTAKAQFLGDLQTLAEDGSREAFELGKVAAIAQVLIDSQAAAMASFNALAGIPFVGPALGAAAAAVAIAAGVSRIASINSSSPNFAHGGIVAGSNFTGDNIGANVNSGEMILNRQQQANLFNLANRNVSGSSDMAEAIDRLGERLENRPIIIIADDNEIARSTSRGVQEGIVIGESR